MWSATNKTFSYPNMSGSCFSSFWSLFDAASLGISGPDTNVSFSQLGLNFSPVHVESQSKTKQANKKKWMRVFLNHYSVL